MPNVTAKIPLDNFVQNGDTTLTELLAAVAAVNGGNNPGIADPVRDPATGKLVQVRLAFPDSVSQNAINAINANPGVPIVCAAVPEPLIGGDLRASGPDGIVFSGVIPSAPFSATIFCQSTVPGPSSFSLGRLLSTGYIDNAARQPGQIHFSFFVQTGQILTIATTELVLNFADGRIVPLLLTNDIVVDGTVVGGQIFHAWVDIDGKMYKSRGANVANYEDDVCTGAL